MKNQKWDYNPSGNLMDQTTRRLMCSALLSDSIIKCYDVGDDETFWSGDIDMLLVNKDFKIDTLEIKAVGFGNARNSLDELSVFLEYISNDKKYLQTGGKQGVGCTRICKATYYLFYFTKIDYYLLFETKQLQDFLERNLEKFPSKASVTYGKNGSLVARRNALAFLHNDNEVVSKVFNDLAKRYENRNGGYTRIIKLKERRGDDALEVKIELV